MGEERRVVTVVFADVVGSTGLGEQLDAEDVRTLLASYFAIAKDVVAGHGGTLEKFIGDAVMGVFGMPKAHGDDAERALSAALELRERVSADEQLAELRLRFGICTGEVVATREPGADFLVTGDAVNVAARLQQAADPWAILAAERTLAAVPEGFEVGPRLEIEVKGKAVPVVAYEVHSRTPPRPGLRPPKGRMRGRDAELEQLALVARRAFRDRRPAFVAILAPAGTGKTRLLEEFLQGPLPDLAPRRLVAIAQCLPYGKQLTYWPLRQVLFGLVGLDADPEPGLLVHRLEAWLGDAMPAELLATSIGYGTGEASDRADVFAAWRRALETASAERPLALVFEDLHWSSESLLDLVDHVMQTHADAPILMLALSRPELLDRRPAWGGGRRNFSNLFLEPLGDGDVGELVRDLLPEVPAATVAAVVARAGGNPFYAEELVRALGGGEAPDALPDTVQGSIQARLDLLPAEERRVLQLGSIFGRTFAIAGVLALEAELAGNLVGVVESLLTKDVLDEEASGELTFSHILIREVAYQALTRAERARLHAAAGAWLESVAGGAERSMAEIVALHYREAATLLGRQRLAGVDESAIRARAVHWLALSGDMAAAAGAQLEASRHYRAAIDLATAPDLPGLYERLGDVEQLRTTSLEAYGRALELGRREGRPAADELRVLGGLLICTMRWAEGVGQFAPEAVQRMLAEGGELARRVRDPRSLARFEAAQSFYPFHVGREGGEVTPEIIAAAEESAHRAQVLAEAAGDWNTWSAATDGLTSSLIERRDFEPALRAAEARVARRAELTVLERMDAFHMVAATSLLNGDLARAEAASRASSALVEHVQNPALVQGLFGDWMYALLLRGDWDEVGALGARILQVWNEFHETLGPGRIGFISGLDLALARHQSIRTAEFRQVVLEVANRSPSGLSFGALAGSDFDAVENALAEAVKYGVGAVEIVERLLSRLNDRGHRLSSATVRALDDYVQYWRVPMVRAQALRARRDFDAAAAIWAGAGARPYEARARLEAARARSEPPPAAALETLRSVGDLEYLESHGLGD